MCDALEKLREALLSRGTRTVAGLGRCFKQLDSYDGNRKLDRGEFKVGLEELGCDLTGDEIEELCNYFDTNGDGVINFDEFLYGVRGPLPEARQAVVDAAYEKFDSDGSGQVSAADLKGVYSGAMHPKVISGEMTEDEVFAEFLGEMGDKNHDDCISRQEWNDYYAAVSANIDNDEHFN